MKPLNYAILKYTTTVDRCCVADVQEALKAAYSSFRMFKPAGILESLMTGEANGFLAEDGYELDANGELVIYYKCIDPDSINSYIK